jgi:transcriptional regulator with XRE-family HTH domain
MAKDIAAGDFPNRIRKYRKARHLQLNQMAILLGVDATGQISAWESGRRLPSVRNLFKISAALRIPPEILLKDLYDEVRHEVQELKNKHQIFEIFD